MCLAERAESWGKREGGVSRRLFLASAAALGSLTLLAQRGWAAACPIWRSNPFTLGVASGDPDENGFVIWTRLAPQPLEADGGMPLEPVKVSWEVALDENMRSVVASGSTLATPQLGHSVHVEVEGLSPDRWYWYRFRSGEAESPIGRTRTFPLPTALPQRLRLGVTSCQSYEAGLFTAYEQMALDELDVVFHLGDYIYEYEAGRMGKVRTHQGGEIQSLADYRIRHAQYRSDPLLHQMHAQCPWLVTWDDHELDNNCANETSEELDVDPVSFLERRCNAYQAYYENMPLRLRSLPQGPDMQLYRSATFGRLAELLVLDTRQYRSDQPNADRRSPLNEAAVNPQQTMLGRTQRGWLSSQLLQSQSTWNVLAQQVMMGMVGLNKTGGEPMYSMDQWPGYAAERMALLRFLQERRITNPIVLTGDIHSNWVNELRVDDRRNEEPLVATEFVTTSLSSGGNGVEAPDGLQQLLAANPCVKFHNGERGYIRCEVTGQKWQADYVVVDDVLQPGGKSSVRRSFVVEAGNPAAKDS
jgi:alkaline phosphatase D